MRGTLLVLFLLVAPSLHAEEPMPLLWPAAHRALAGELSNITAWSAIGLDTVKMVRRDDLTWQQALGCQALKYGAIAGTVGILKKVIHRERFDHSNFYSFPSGHTANAMAGWDYRFSIPIGIGTGALRNGAGKHYPSDILAGAGIGLLASRICR